VRHKELPVRKRSRMRTVLSDREIGEISDLLDTAGRLFPLPPERGDFTATAAALRAVEEALRQALTGTDAADDRSVLLLQASQAVETLRAARERHRAGLLRAVGRQLARLSAVPTPARLMADAPAAAVALGFDRASYSGIHFAGRITLCESIHVDGDPAQAGELRRRLGGQTFPVATPTSRPELRRWRSGALIADPAADPRFPPELAELFPAGGLVVAPVFSGGTPIGYLHADRYRHAEDVDSFDADCLAVFAAGVGYAHERLQLMDRLARLREEIDENLAGEEPVPVRPAADAAALRNAGLGRTVTERERDILWLLAEGRTNGQIARQLNLSEAMVKAHLKAVFRKLGASNRAQAVSRWLGLAAGS